MNRGDNIVCDVCLRRVRKQDHICDILGLWKLRNGKDICPVCAYTVNRALALELVQGEMFGLDESVLGVTP